MAGGRATAHLGLGRTGTAGRAGHCAGLCRVLCTHLIHIVAEGVAVAVYEAADVVAVLVVVLERDDQIAVEAGVVPAVIHFEAVRGVEHVVLDFVKVEGRLSVFFERGFCDSFTWCEGSRTVEAPFQPNTKQVTISR